MTGGGSKSRTWIQAKADILNLPVHVPHIKEATALGAAMLAGVGAGVYADYNGAVQTAAALGGEVYEPRKDAAHVYNEIYHEKYLKFISLLQG
jgi:autoinducer 2 (AI-2) kinase